MNRVKIIIFFICALLAFRCSNLNDSSPLNRSAFLFTYGGTGNYKGIAAIETQDGFLLIADSLGAESRAGIIIKTNSFGLTQWRKKVDGASFSSIVAVDDGYIICGDSIKIDLTKLRVIDQTRTKMRLIKLSKNGIVLKDVNEGDILRDDASRYDVKGSAVNLSKNGDVIVTSTVSFPNSTVSTYTRVSAFDPATFKAKWSGLYNQDNNRDYVNGKSVLTTPSGNVIWAASAFAGNSQNGVSFLRIPVLAPDAPPTNGGQFGFDDPTNFYSGSDISSNGSNFGIIGTYQNSTGQNANMYFIRTDLLGNPLPSTALFFDGLASAQNQPLSDRTVSEVQDQGICVSATQDGGFLLAGYTTSTADGRWGNGGKDAYFIKLDAFGKMYWNKFHGGTGDEIPNSVKQTTDGGYLICGTSTLADQSLIFLLKLNNNGELKN